MITVRVCLEIQMHLDRRADIASPWVAAMTAVTMVKKESAQIN